MQASIVLRGEDQRRLAHAKLDNAPMDPDRPLQMLIQEIPKVRGLDANAAMWAGPLADIAEQLRVDGRCFDARVWNEYFKEQFLPEEFDPELTREGYRKWAITPSGKRTLVGSTTDLLVKGMAIYMTQVEAYGANAGVRFHVSPEQAGGR